MDNFNCPERVLSIQASAMMSSKRLQTNIIGIHVLGDWMTKRIEENTMRNLVEVLEQVLAAVPQEADRVYYALVSVQDSAKYASPESMSYQWMRAAEVLQNEIGTPVEDWHKQVQTIFTGSEKPQCSTSNG